MKFIKQFNLSILGSLLALLSGCMVTSVHPYFASGDVIYEPALVGQWTNLQQADESWTFRREGFDAYGLTFVSGDKTNVVYAHLFKLDGQRFFDFAGRDRQCGILPPPVPAHFLLRVSQFAPTLRLAPLNHDWLRNWLQQNPSAIGYELVGEKPEDRRVVLTAETPELQRFLRAHLETEEAWQDPLELKRVDPPECRERGDSGAKSHVPRPAQVPIP